MKSKVIRIKKDNRPVKFIRLKYPKQIFPEYYIKMRREDIVERMATRNKFISKLENNRFERLLVQMDSKHDMYPKEFIFQRKKKGVKLIDFWNF